jgi:hypothetical protein
MASTTRDFREDVDFSRHAKSGLGGKTVVVRQIRVQGDARDV